MADAISDNDEAQDSKVEQSVSHIVSALTQHLGLLEDGGIEENCLHEVVRCDARYGRAASSREAAQVLATTMLEFRRTWSQNFKLGSIISRNGLHMALNRIAEDLPAYFKVMPQMYQFYVVNKSRDKKGQILRQQL